jgi:transposase
MKITAIGLDLAKNVFQVHGVDERGHALVKKALKRAQLATFFASIPACLVGMEACSGAHFWARKLQGFGHTVRLISPQFVRPYVKFPAGIFHAGQQAATPASSKSGCTAAI